MPNFRGNKEEDRAQAEEMTKEEIAALKRKLAHTTDSAKRAEINARLARHGEDPNEDSLRGNPVPDRKSPPKATADASPDLDANKAATKARGGKPQVMDRGYGQQEMINHDTGEWSIDNEPGHQDMHDFSKDDVNDKENADPIKDEAKPKAPEKKTDPKKREASKASDPGDNSEMEETNRESQRRKPAAKKSEPKKDEKAKDDEVHVSGDLKVSDPKKDEKPKDVTGSGGLTLPKTDSKG